MKLRNLLITDAKYMLSWMHDKNVTSGMRTDFASKTMEDAENFIKKNSVETEDLNLAIVDDDNTYMGTVSLKHIHNGIAEFAIVVRSEAMGLGYAWFGMKNILKIAFEKMGLERIYWCVRTDNRRALRFYDKHAFQKTSVVPDELLQYYGKDDTLEWYAAVKDNM